MRRILFPLWIFVFVFFIALFAVEISAGDDLQVRIPLPKKSKYTPVQQLNREGVDALKKHQTDRAKRLFYKAYLIDPNDPFTLNNLGYVSELEGDMDRAQRFYDLAQANTSQAVVAKSTVKDVEGKTVSVVAAHTAQGPLEANALNNEAVSLLKKERTSEADLVLQRALKIEPNNPFTLNDLGFTKEKEGDLEQAIRYYKQAAASGSTDMVVIAINEDWRGKSISQIAARNAEKAAQELQKSADIPDKVARLNMRAVSAMNRNDRKAARELFQEAYKLDPNNAFALNNMGYLSEMDGDAETAQDFYERARLAERAGAPVAVSTRPENEGQSLERVAEQSDNLVGVKMEVDVEAKRRSGVPPVLHTRDNRPIVDKPTPSPPKPQ